MPKKPSGLEQLLVAELQDLLDAERQLVRALPRMAKAASDDELESTLREHLEITKGHVHRIERVFESMDMKAHGRPCTGMKGILEESAQALRETYVHEVLDAAIAGGASKVEHYEIAGYEAVIFMAKQLGRHDAASLLRATLKEEAEAGKRLMRISRQLMKRAVSAARRSIPAPATAAMWNPAAIFRAGVDYAQPLVDREEIRHWAEEHMAQPSCVTGAGGQGDIGMLRLSVAGSSGEEPLEKISWDEWFHQFDASELALLVQESGESGHESSFHKLVKRDAVEGIGHSKTRSAA